MLRLVAGVLCALVVASPVLAQEAPDAQPAQQAPEVQQAQPAPEAQEPAGYLELMLVPDADLRVNDSTGNLAASPNQRLSSGGDGKGGRARIALGMGLFIQGEAQTNDYDGLTPPTSSGIRARFMRIGLGYKYRDTPLYGLVEVINQKIDYGHTVIYSPDGSGYGAHVGVRGGQRLAGHAQLGLVDVSGFGAGLEYSVGATVRLNRIISLFADYRRTKQEDNAGGMYEFTDTRAGVRINFVRGKSKKPKPTKERRF